MNRVLVTLLCLAVALTGPLVAGGRQEKLETRIDLPDPLRVSGTTYYIFGQGPSLSEWGIYNAIPADRTCDVACPPTQTQRSVAVASPGYDGAALSFRINEVEVWGIYKAGALDPGTPPAEDSFTVRVHGGFALPSPEVCSRPGIVGTREIVDTVLGFDVYLHTLRLPAPCVVTAPDGRVWWIEVFNDTGPADDWFWLGGIESYAWPFDCCWYFSSYGTEYDLYNAPGVNWRQSFTPLAFASKLTHVGETQGLRLSKPSDDELLLQWDGDCGGGGDYSVYRGSLLAGYGSLAPEPGLCDISGTTAVVPAGEGAADFFLVAPWVASGAGSFCDPADDNCRSQGSYGADSDGTPRPQAETYCYWQAPQDSTHDCAP